MTYVLGSEDNFVEVVLFFNSYMGSRDGPPGQQALPAKQSHQPYFYIFEKSFYFN